jgi:hypothetical protein
VFYYLGRKGRAAKTYPAPEYPLVIEPFAGSMAYSLHWRPSFAIGIERDEQTADLWHRLVSMTPQEIRGHTAPVVGERTTDRWVIQAGQSNWSNDSNYRTVTPWMVQHFDQQRRLALKHLDYAKRSVLYRCGDYRDAPDVEATWFIDPPYEGVIRGYRYGNPDYDELATWCLSRKGQVIVCEGPGATWLPFQRHGAWTGVPTQGRREEPFVEKVLVTRTHRQCQQCSKTFPASRSDARFCSARCRKRASRLG